MKMLPWFLGCLLLGMACGLGSNSQPPNRPPAPSSRPTIQITATESAVAGVSGKLNGLGGGIWYIPNTMPWVERDLELSPNLGVIRVAIGWELLAASSSKPDLEARLAVFRLNPRLQRLAQQGAEIMILLDAMPPWLASDSSSATFGDGPTWARVPPASYGGWADAVTSVVRHFNGTLGLNARYEVWNEADWSFKGTIEEYFNLYQYSVLGARRADPAALVGGPGISAWTAVGTWGSQANNLANLAKGDSGLFLNQFFNYAATTGIPELGLTRLPLDFVSWHGFYRDPAQHYGFLVPRIRTWLAQHGYPASTPLIDTEWNIGATPPYPEGDLQAGAPGAAYVAASIAAMEASGLDRQNFQMLVDPGTPNYWGGMYDITGLPRANGFVHQALASLSGDPLRATSSDAWVATVARGRAGSLDLMVSVFPSTDLMVAKAVFEPFQVTDPALTVKLASLGPSVLITFLQNGQHVSGTALTDADWAKLDAVQQDYSSQAKKRDLWKDGVDLEITLPRLVSSYTSATLTLIDDTHGNPQPQADALKASMVQAAVVAGKVALADLTSQGATTLEIQAFSNAIGSVSDIEPLHASATAAEWVMYQRSFGKYVDSYQAARAQALAPYIQQMGPTPLALPGTGTVLKLQAKLNSVLLIKLRP